MALARCCGLSSVAAYPAGFLSVGLWALRQRLRQTYQPARAKSGSARSQFDHALCFAPPVR